MMFIAWIISLFVAPVPGWFSLMLFLFMFLE